MSVDRKPQTRFVNDSEQSERSAREQLKFINANESSLLRILNGKKYAMTAKEFSERTEPFTPNEKSYIDVIYEKTMKGLGLPSFSASFKPKRRSI